MAARSRTRQPDLAVLGYPVVSMVTPTHEGSRHALLGAEGSDAERAAVSLELLVTPDSPPVFLWSTADDEAVPTHPLAAALAANGVWHEVHVFASGVHGLGLGLATPSAA